MSDQETGSAVTFKDIERAGGMMRLAKFLRSAERTSHLSREHRLRIVEQALLLLEMNYVHLPLKQAMHAINPLQLLKLMKYRLETKGRQLEPVMQFHNRMLDIFASLRDVHTCYYLPAPFADQIAFLPFLVEQCFERDARGNRSEKFLVSRAMPQMVDEGSLAGPSAVSFEKGVEALNWSGVPIRRAIELNGQNQAGSNPEARLARGLDNLTVRPLDTMLPPDEEWVDLTYKSKAGEILTQRFEWWVYNSSSETGKAADQKKRAAIDIKKTKTNQFKKTFFAPPRPVKVRQAFKQNFYDETRVVGGREYGYLRLFSFEVPDQSKVVDQFVNEVRRVITADGFPQEGLILDVRGNPGGTIRAGERLLQLFTPQRIKPEPFEFINTPLNLEICQRAPKSYSLFRWIPSIAESVQTGATYSMGFPLQPEESCNALGQAYYGPVILITDALSYSTTDIFAAGFQDHKIGEILGTSDNTGAGGANVWTYDELIEVLGSGPRSKFKPLPGNVTFRLALRRSVRVGERQGRPLEELGITPDDRHYMTKNDLMRHNPDLVRQAARILANYPSYRLSVEPGKGPNRTLLVSASSKVRPRDRRKRIARLDVLINGRPHKSLNARNGGLPRTQVAAGTSQKFDWVVQAFDHDNRLVAAARRQP